jgi:hypothetical protein
MRGARAIVVDGTADRAAIDATGIPRNARHLTAYEHDRLALNQLVFLLESAWLQPQPVEVRHNVLVGAGGGTRLQIVSQRRRPARAGLVASETLRKTAKRCTTTGCSTTASSRA